LKLGCLLHVMFRYPPFYSYPPSFTLQPVKATREKQLKLWCDLVLSYCKHYKIFKLSVTECATWSLFVNTSIDRKLSVDAIEKVLSRLVSMGYGEWLNKEANVCLVYWRRPNEWAQLIYDWVERSGRRKSILTLYEIRFSEDTVELEFHEMDIELLLKSLQVLESQGKCVIFEGKTSDDLGVKFL
jgi:ESCRT-II complex subunit VPS25